MVGEVDHFLVDQASTTLFVARCLDLAGVYADGSEWANPVREWPLTEEQREAIAVVGGRLRFLLVATAQLLAELGVPLQPDALTNLLVLGQLLLLEADLDRTPQAIVDDLNIVAAGGFDRSGLQLHTSDHLTAEDERLLSHLRRSYRESLGHRHHTASYAGGAKRQSRPSTVTRRKALLQVHDEFPSATAAKIHQTWLMKAGPGGQLRKLLGPGAARPSESTLRSDMRALGITRKHRS